MLQEIFYISGIAVNVGIIYTLYKLNEPKIKIGYSLIKKEEEERHNLHSSQSVGHLFEKEAEEQTQEEKIEERLKKANVNYLCLKNWLNYIPGLVSKKD